MALQTGDRVNFVYVSGSTLPSSPDDATMYFLNGSQQLYIGSRLIASVSDPDAVKGVFVNGTSVIDSSHFAQIKSYKEVTQSEYDALPASKLTDNIMYLIKDAGGIASTISITPTLTSGTKVADYEIDGVAGAIYAPTAPTALSQLSDDSTHRTVTDAEKTTWNDKQNALTFDDAPTDGSNNPVKSGGVYTALAGKANSSDVPALDSTLTLTNAAAQAKATGDKISELRTTLANTEDVIVAGRKYVDCPSCKGWLGSNDTQWQSIDGAYQFAIIPVKGGNVIELTTSNSYATYLLFLKSYKTPVVGENIDFTDTTTLSYKRITQGDTKKWTINKRVTCGSGNHVEFVIPNDVNFLLVTNVLNSTVAKPTSLYLNGETTAKGILTQLLNMPSASDLQGGGNVYYVDNDIVRAYLINTKYSPTQFDATSSPKHYTVEDVSKYVAYNGTSQKDGANAVVINVPFYSSADSYKIYVSKNALYVGAISVTAQTGDNAIKWLEVGRSYWVKSVAVLSNSTEVTLAEKYIETKGERRINCMEGIGNFRDLGNQVGLNGRKLRQGRLFRCANVANLTSGDKNIIENILGVTLVAGLAQDTEDEGLFSNTVETFHPYNLAQWGNLSDADTRRKYTVYLRKFITHLTNGGAVIYHCNGGADRTGLMSAIIEGICGVDDNHICMDYELTSFSLNGSQNLSRTRMGEKSGDSSYTNKGFGNGIYNIREGAWGGDTYTERWVHAFTDANIALEPETSTDFPDGFTPMSTAEIETLRNLVLE